jgi:hypothetical protein
MVIWRKRKVESWLRERPQYAEGSEERLESLRRV